MGSVAHVKKRPMAIGGSSKEEFVKYQHPTPIDVCARIPLVDAFLRMCTGQSNEVNKKRAKFESFSSFSDPLSYSIMEPEAEANNTNTINDKTTSSSTSNHYNYAMKSIQLDRLTNDVYIDELKNEIMILKALDHPNIVRPLETFQYDRQYYMVMELCHGGDLYTRMPYSEQEACRITESICNALSYLHSQNVIHRDLKFENVLFTDPASPDVKLIDFGLSKKYVPREKINDGVGTIYTMAPEVIHTSREGYDDKVDLWSLGVIAYMLLSSQMPFYGNTRLSVMKKIIGCQYNFKGAKWRTPSLSSKKFVAQLLQLDPKARPTADEALKSRWFTNVLHRPHNNNKYNHTHNDNNNNNNNNSKWTKQMDRAQASLENFAGFSKLKKLALMVIAHKSTNTDIGFLRQLFDRYDTHHTGMITYPEFVEALGPYSYTKNELQAMFRGADVDGTNIIHYTEFLAATMQARGDVVVNKETLAEAFDRLDADDTGYISTGNLRALFGKELPESALNAIIEEVHDTTSSSPNEDQNITFAQFLQLFQDELSDQNKKQQDQEIKVEERRIQHYFDNNNNDDDSNNNTNDDPMMKMLASSIANGLDASSSSSSSSVASGGDAEHNNKNNNEQQVPMLNTIHPKAKVDSMAATVPSNEPMLLLSEGHQQQQPPPLLDPQDGNEIYKAATSVATTSGMIPPEMTETERSIVGATRENSILHAHDLVPSTVRVPQLEFEQESSN